MIARDMARAIWVNAIALMAIRDRIVRRASVRCCVQLMDTTEAECVIAKTVGKDQNAIFQSLNVRCQLVQVMVVALKANVIAIVDGKDHFVIKVCIKNSSLLSHVLKHFLSSQLIAKIQHALVMEVAFLVNVSVKLDGKEKIVEQETSKFINACPAALIMDTTISKLLHASAIVTGLVTIARKLFAVSTVDQTEFVNRLVVVAILVGQELSANN